MNNKIISILAFALVLCVYSFAFAQDDTAKFGARCAKCHEDEVTSFNNSHHAKTWGATGRQANCESCHGDPTTHIKEENKAAIIVFGDRKGARPASEQNKQCLECHKNTSLLSVWPASTHKRNDVACANCHSVHAAKDVRNPETCFACHKEIKMLVSKSSHHPVKEGKVVCADCHNPHGSLGHGNLKADNVNQLCYRCHADKRGPFMWEHMPVEENCTTCHNPHGSNHYDLLVKRPPRLCQDCHGTGHGQTVLDGTMGFTENREAAPPAAQARFFRTRACMACHSRIHGSNGPTLGKALVR